MSSMDSLIVTIANLNNHAYNMGFIDGLIIGLGIILSTICFIIRIYNYIIYKNLSYRFRIMDDSRNNEKENTLQSGPKSSLDRHGGSTTRRPKI